MNTKTVDIIGAGLSGCEAALQLAARGVHVNLYEMRPLRSTPVHTGGGCAELVCSNSLKSTKPDSAAGMLKHELSALGSQLIAAAYKCSVPAGGALAVDREAFSAMVGFLVAANPLITKVVGEVVALGPEGQVCYVGEDETRHEAKQADAVMFASGPLTSDLLAQYVLSLTGSDHLAFYDAAAPIVMADSLDMSILFRQSRYEDNGAGDYLNAPFTREEYKSFIRELLNADRVIARDFETKDLFNACQPIEEIARKGFDAPRHGTMKPVGLTDPETGKRPWAALQLRAEDAHGSAYNLVGFQTNLTFPEQRRVFRMIPGLKDAEFARYGVMHRNTFIDAPKVLASDLSLRECVLPVPVFVVGQLGGTEGYCEAIMSGLYGSLAAYARITETELPELPAETAFGSLVRYATSPDTKDYQPMHVNFGIFEPLDPPIRNKGQRYEAYAKRGAAAIDEYASALRQQGIGVADVPEA
ncbi:MAG: methylenetetrahydrofolate--tRNA-(uracil(54)-C(5))-methyltransferase (FADH(2)-oxidizing) TrmFO [Eggerthellaceae bacterium]